MSETRPRDRSDEDRTDSNRPTVTSHDCSAERTVFTEADNSDGWIATDLTVSLRQ